MKKEELEKAILAAGNKDFKSFQSQLNVAVEDKLKTRMKSFLDHLEKNTFEK